MISGCYNRHVITFLFQFSYYCSLVWFKRKTTRWTALKEYYHCYYHYHFLLILITIIIIIELLSCLVILYYKYPIENDGCFNYLC